MGEGHQRAWRVAIGHTLLRESTQYPRREFWVLSPSASCPSQPCCGLNMSPQAPTCLLLHVCSCWRHCFGKLWNFGRRGPEGGTGSWGGCLKVLTCPYFCSVSLLPGLLPVGYPLLHALPSMKWPVPAVISSPWWTHTPHTHPETVRQK